MSDRCHRCPGCRFVVLLPEDIERCAPGARGKVVCLACGAPRKRGCWATAEDMQALTTVSDRVAKELRAADERLVSATRGGAQGRLL